MATALIAILAAPAATASPEVAAICDQVASAASRQTGVPLSVLKAISLTETGRKSDDGFRPWPWTVNMEGRGFWFETEDEARAYVYKEYKRGARSFDVGCFQINYKWHGQEFASIDAMFDPMENALYAARFLQTLHAETGAWSKAAGAYHSRTPEYAERYAARFDRFRKGLLAEDGRDIPEIPDIVLAMAGSTVGAGAPAAPRVNTYPLLQARDTGTTLGSLVPMGGGTGLGLFARPSVPGDEG